MMWYEKYCLKNLKSIFKIFIGSIFIIFFVFISFNKTSGNEISQEEKTALKKMIDIGIIAGSDEKDFKWENPMTWIEEGVILDRFIIFTGLLGSNYLGKTIYTESFTCGFKNWAISSFARLCNIRLCDSEYIRFVCKYTKKQMTRAELIFFIDIMIEKLELSQNYKFQNESSDCENFYTDSSYWGAKYVNNIYCRGIISDAVKEKYKYSRLLKKLTNRYELALLLDGVLNYLEKIKIYNPEIK